VFQVDLGVSTVSKVRLNNEKLLIKKLTENYPQKFGRPFLNDSSEPLYIKIRAQLIQIVELVCRQNLITTF
jgi:hypothetical protein